ncbi:MAG: leucine-rich repeat protein [Dehalobacterium sp.]
MYKKAIHPQKNVSLRLLALLLPVLLMVSFLSVTVFAEDGEANHEGPFLRTEAAEEPNIEVVLMLDMAYTLDLTTIFHHYDSPLTYYVKEGGGSYQKTPEEFKYAYRGSAKEAVIELSFKASDGKLESPAYHVTLKYYEDPSLEWLSYSVGETGVTITGCDGNATRVYIPDYIENKPVTSIGGFASCRELTEIRLPSTLRLIKYAAFRGCESLEKIELPEGLTTIGENAFANCTALREVHLPAGLTEFNVNIFNNCQDIRFFVAEKNPNYTSKDGDIYSKDMTVLVRVGAIEEGRYVVPATVSRIGDEAFFTGSVKSVTLGPNVQSIGKDAFNGCEQLEEIVLNEGLETIGESAFAGTTSLKALELPNSLTSVGETVFRGSGLEKIDFSHTRVETLPRGIFWDCENLQDINLGDTITVIGDGAFRNCTFKEIILPDHLRRLGGSVFNNCANLETITMPYTLNAMGSNVFANCLALESLYFEGNMPMRGTDWNVNPDGVIPRHNDVFAHLPLETAENLKIYALEGTRGWGNSFTDYADGYPMGEIARVPFEYKVEYYTLDEEQEEPRLLLSPPESLASLEAGSVSEAVYVIKAGMPDGAGPVSWSSSDPGVATVDSTGRVKGISQGASIIIAAVTYEDKTYTAEVGVNVTGGEEEETIFDWSIQSDGTVRINGFREGVSETEMIHLEIPETIAGYRVSKIKQSAFANNPYIFSVTIPGTVDIIGQSAFANTPFLRELTIEEGVKELHSGAFGGSKIKEVVVPESVTKIQDSVFAGCNQLETAVIKADISGPYGMGRALFQNNTGLKNVTFAEGIEGIGTFTFDGCTSLETITLPSTLQLLEQNVFRNNTSLRTVEFQGSLTRQAVSITAQERFNPFSGTQNVVVVHPDDGNDWGRFFGDMVTTHVRGATGIQLTSPGSLPSDSVDAAYTESAAATPWDAALESRSETVNTGTEKPEQDDESSVEQEAQGTGQKAMTVYEVVKDTIAVNPVVTILLAVIVTAVIIFGGAGRYRSYKRNK